MTNRREFLQTGVSVTALPLAVNGLLPAETAHSTIAAGKAPLHKAIFDDRYAEGRLFAETIGRFGVPTYSLPNGDVTELWFDELDLLWRERPAVIAGVTQFGPMFALEQLAHERGMRVALRVEHQHRPDGTLAHVLSGAPETLALAEELRPQGVAWPVLIAAVLAYCRTDCMAPASRTLVMPGVRPALAQSHAGPERVIHYYDGVAIQEGRGVSWDGPLFSWLIAPRA